MRNRALLAVGVLAVASLALTAALQAAPKKQQAKKVTLQLKWVTQAQFAGYYAAKEKGYYQKAGLDVNLAAARGVWNGLGQPDRLRPSPVQERLVAAGRLGRKTGAGFYRYDEGRRGPVDPEFAEGPAREMRPERVRDRIEAAVADEARLAIDEQVASQDDIRLALRLGASYPDRALDALSER